MINKRILYTIIFFCVCIFSIIPLIKIFKWYKITPAVRGLLEDLQSDIPSVRADAAKQLRDFGDEAQPAIPTLIFMLRDYESQPQTQDETVPAIAAYMTLNAIGTSITAPLIASILDRTTPHRSANAELLEKLHDPLTIPVFLDLLNDKDEDVQDVAIIALGMLKDNRAVIPLVQKLHENSNSMRIKYSIVKSLGNLCNEQSTDTLIGILADSNENDFLRCTAAAGLGKERNQKAYDIYSSILKTESTSLELRSTILAALGNYKTDNAYCLIIKHLKNNDEKIQIGALRGLGVLASPKSINTLIIYLNNDKMSYKIRFCALNSLLDTGNDHAIYTAIKYFRSFRKNINLLPKPKPGLVTPEYTQWAEMLKEYLLCIDHIIRSTHPNVYIYTVDIIQEQDDHYGKIEALRVLSCLDDPEWSCWRSNINTVPALANPKIRYSLLKIVDNPNESKKNRDSAKWALQKGGAAAKLITEKFASDTSARGVSKP
jgi:HEAT repeat protein